MRRYLFIERFDRGKCKNGGLIVPKWKKERIRESQPLRERTSSWLKSVPGSKRLNAAATVNVREAS